MLNALGIDTSNYTTSAAVLRQDGIFVNSRKLLNVKDGAIGLRQSEALFQHTKALPEIIKAAFKDGDKIDAVGVSTRPRPVMGSYMPCFLAGVSAAEAISAAAGVPIFKFSHQAGHIAAALFSSGMTGLIGKKFISFHVSGGTTEALLVEYDKDEFFKATIAAESLDLKIGQAVDRIGNMLGLSFPAGKELDKLSLSGTSPIKPKITLKSGNCSISGLQNKAEQLYKSGASREDTARFTFDYITAVISGMTEYLLREYGELPLVFAGGVMSNTIIRKAITEKFGAYFASPELSSDNAVGIAFMTEYLLNEG